MKQLIFILCLLMLGISNAQTVNDVPLKDINVEYIQIVGTEKLLSTKITIQIDFGQATSLWKATDNIIKDENAKPVVFNSMIDALNFFSKNGYDFVTAYVLTVSNQNVYHYLLRKNKQ